LAKLLNWFVIENASHIVDCHFRTILGVIYSCAKERRGEGEEGGAEIGGY
jgi:hypothetical protein